MQVWQTGITAKKDTLVVLVGWLIKKNDLQNFI